MFARTPRSPRSQPRQSPRLSPAGQGYNTKELYQDQQTTSITDCDSRAFDFRIPAPGLPPKDLTIQALDRERYWGSLELAWLARNTFEEWRNIAIIKNFAGEPAIAHSKEDKLESSKFVLLSQLQNELAAKDALIAQLRNDLEHALLKSHNAKQGEIVCIADVAIEIRGAQVAALLKQLVFSSWQYVCLETRRVAQVNSLEARLREKGSFQSHPLPTSEQTRLVKSGIRTHMNNAKLCLRCLTTWISYCNTCKFVIELEAQHQEHICRFEEMVSDINFERAAAIRRAALTTASKCFGMELHLEGATIFRDCFHYWSQLHTQKRDESLQRSSHLIDRIRNILSWISLLDVCSAWSQQAERSRLSGAVKSGRESWLSSVAKRMQPLQWMQAQQILLHSVLAWAMYGVRHLRIKALATSCRHRLLSWPISDVFGKWSERCASLKHTRCLLQLAQRAPLGPCLLHTEVHDTWGSYMFMVSVLSQWRLEIERDCRRQERATHQQLLADSHGEKSRIIKQYDDAMMSRLRDLRQIIVLDRLGFLEFGAKSGVFNAWALFYNSARWCSLGRHRDTRWILHYRSLHDSAFLCARVRIIFESWRSHTNIEFTDGDDNHRGRSPLRNVRDHFRAFAHWRLWILHESWRRKQQELVLLLTQAREHLSEAESDRGDCRATMRTFAHAKIHAYALLHIGLTTLRALIAWHNVAALACRHGIEDELGKEVALLRIRVCEGKFRLAEAKSFAKVNAIAIFVAHQILTRWWQHCCKNCSATQVCRALRSKASIVAQQQVLAHWRMASRVARSDCKLESLQRDLQRSKLRDLAIVGHCLLLPFIRLEAYVSIYVVFSTWRGLVVDLRNMEVVERLISDTQASRIRLDSRIRQLLDNTLGLRRAMIAYSTMIFWREEVINLRMQRSLEYVQGLAAIIRNQVTRRILQKRATLLSNCLDSWRWMADLATHHQRNSVLHVQAVWDHACEHQLWDCETREDSRKALALQSSPACRGQNLAPVMSRSPCSIASSNLGVFRK